MNAYDFWFNILDFEVISPPQQYLGVKENQLLTGRMGLPRYLSPQGRTYSPLKK